MKPSSSRGWSPCRRPLPRWLDSSAAQPEPSSTATQDRSSLMAYVFNRALSWREEQCRWWKGIYSAACRIREWKLRWIRRKRNSRDWERGKQQVGRRRRRWSDLKGITVVMRWKVVALMEAREEGGRDRSEGDWRGSINLKNVYLDENFIQLVHLVWRKQLNSTQLVQLYILLIDNIFIVFIQLLFGNLHTIYLPTTSSWELSRGTRRCSHMNQARKMQESYNKCFNYLCSQL